MIRQLMQIGVAICLAATTLPGQIGGFAVPPDTVAESDIEPLPREKARIFAGKPGKAALYSLILPGAGQAYNKKYWQVPIVWGGVGTAGYIMIQNSRDYRGYRDAYNAHLLAEKEGLPPPSLEYPYNRYSKNQLLNIRNEFNRYRQLSIIGFAATWLANSAQAYVSAHLKDFDIDDDLSFQIVPIIGSDIAFGSFPLSASILVTF